MSRLATLSLATALLGACGLSPRAYCEDVSRVTCDRLFACTSGAERTALESLYADAAACTKAFRERSQCPTQTEQSLCGSSLEWVPANAAACVEELRVLSCDQLTTYRPTCERPCQPPQ